MPFSDRHWYRLTWLSVALLPLASVFRLMANLRRFAYRIGVLRSERLSVPVIVVGNVTAGGTGKTPLTLWLCGILQEKGFSPGIVSRGYGGRASLLAVNAGSDPVAAGDEPVLLARRSRCPVWIGRDRVAAARALLTASPECDVIVCDDGLQHYRLQRDVEIVVVDGNRGLGNRLPLPAGPLREGAARLRSVDAVVINGPGDPVLRLGSCFDMSLEGSHFHNLLNPSHVAAASDFQGRRLHAVAGIGNPLRFFEHLQRLGLSFTAHAFPDHHSFAPVDLEFEDADEIIMTEKDAIKCQRFARENQWALPVDAVVDPQLAQLVLNKLKSRHGS
ncbi:MAG TPA: tetraacyldisaccharide 4'-kinase [Burkholderiales bacterium]|nr:tetraacyldisaccharide 4'-kinase [Burkholderiales bacterium]